MALELGVWVSGALAAFTLGSTLFYLLDTSSAVGGGGGVGFGFVMLFACWKLSGYSARWNDER